MGVGDAAHATSAVYESARGKRRGKQRNKKNCEKYQATFNLADDNKKSPCKNQHEAKQDEMQ